MAQLPQPLSTSILNFSSAFESPTLLVGSPTAVAEQFPEHAAALLECSNIKLCGELPDTDPACELWQRIQTLQPDRIWIVGGDGTINLVGQCALRASRPIPCWLTPAGTANDLARSLSERFMNGDAVLEKPMPRISPQISVDLLSVKLDNNPWVQCSANMLTLGTSARNTHHVTTEIKSRWDALAYLTQIWRAMADLEPFTIRLTVGSTEPRTVDNILNVFIANGKYCGGGFQIAPQASIDDALMDVLIIRQGTTTELTHLATSYLTGNHSEHNLVEHFTAKHLKIQCDNSSPITLDGESFTAKSIEIDIQPARLPTSLVLPQ